MLERSTIGIFGGTFDPIHMGHLRMALELKQHLSLDEMRLLPCHIPPHRHPPHAGAEDRAAMTRLALGHCPELSVDEVELRNDEPSFSVSTLATLRAQLGDEVSLCLAMGMDSLVNFNTWYRWRDILSLAHLVVAARPGWQRPDSGEIGAYLQQYRGEAQDLHSNAAGSIVIEELTLLPISSTEIRALIAAGRSAQFLLPDPVWQYILDHKLYRSAGNLTADNSLLSDSPHSPDWQ